MLHNYFALCTLMPCTIGPSHAKPLTAKKTWQRLQQQSLSATDRCTGSTNEKEIDRHLQHCMQFRASFRLVLGQTHVNTQAEWCDSALYMPFLFHSWAICSSRSWKASWISQLVARWLQKVSSHIRQTENTWRPTWGIPNQNEKYSSCILEQSTHVLV